jgi:hypothetical protein
VAGARLSCVSSHSLRPHTPTHTHTYTPTHTRTHIHTDSLTHSRGSFHEMDPLVFTDGMQFLWRNGEHHNRVQSPPLFMIVSRTLEGAVYRHCFRLRSRIISLPHTLPSLGWQVIWWTSTRASSATRRAAATSSALPHARTLCLMPGCTPGSAASQCFPLFSDSLIPWLLCLPRVFCTPESPSKSVMCPSPPEETLGLTRQARVLASFQHSLVAMRNLLIVLLALTSCATGAVGDNFLLGVQGESCSASCGRVGCACLAQLPPTIDIRAALKVSAPCAPPRCSFFTDTTMQGLEISCEIDAEALQDGQIGFVNDTASPRHGRCVSTSSLFRSAPCEVGRAFLS